MYTWDSGKMISFMEMESICIIVAKNIKVNLLKEGKTDEEFTIIHLEPSMMGNGKMIEKMDSEFLIMLMKRNFKEIG